MGRFILGRLLAIVPVLVLVTAGVFFLIHLTPGDPIAGHPVDVDPVGI